MILFIVGLGFGVMWAASRLAMRHHDNVLQGIVDFQNADDRGEVARTVGSCIWKRRIIGVTANGRSWGLRSG